MGAKKLEDIDCENCKWVVPLLPANEEAVILLERIGAGLVSCGPFGAYVNYHAIETVFNLYGISDKRRPGLFKKIQIYIDVMLEHYSNEMGKGS